MAEWGGRRTPAQSAKEAGALGQDRLPSHRSGSPASWPGAPADQRPEPAPLGHRRRGHRRDNLFYARAGRHLQAAVVGHGGPLAATTTSRV